MIQKLYSLFHQPASSNPHRQSQNFSVRRDLITSRTIMRTLPTRKITKCVS